MRWLRHLRDRRAISRRAALLPRSRLAAAPYILGRDELGRVICSSTPDAPPRR